MGFQNGNGASESQGHHRNQHHDECDAHHWNAAVVTKLDFNGGALGASSSMRAFKRPMAGPIRSSAMMMAVHGRQ